MREVMRAEDRVYSHSLALRGNWALCSELLFSRTSDTRLNDNATH